MFLHTHPYPPFIPDGATRLIVGTLPPPRFTTGDLREGDVDFCYGSRDGLLWPILDAIFNLDLVYENTGHAIEQRKDFLRREGIGICDIVSSAKRKKIDASDLGMQEVELRNLLAILEDHTTVKTLLFTGGNSKNGPEYFFRRLIKQEAVELFTISDKVPRRYGLIHPASGVALTTVSLTAPSGSANRAIGSIAAYKNRKQLDSKYTTLDFRIEQYRPYFMD